MSWKQKIYEQIVSLALFLGRGGKKKILKDSSDIALEICFLICIKKI